MVKKGAFEDSIMSEHGNWNVAADYARLKIMKQLYLADEYEIIATFGFSSFIEEITINVSPDYLKIGGIKRLIKALLMVIDNSMFAIKGTEKKTLEDLRKELVRYKKVIPTLYKYSKDERRKSRELKLEQEKYDLALDRIIEIKAEINEPLNKYDLIFSYKEEFDPAKAKEMIKDILTSRG